MSESEDSSSEDEFMHLHPSLEQENLSIAEKEDDIYMENDAKGYWLLSYSKESLDAVWIRAIFMYRTRELIGISRIRCSTAAPNPRLPDKSIGEICFECGPCTKKETIIEYGRNVVSKMKYFNKQGFVAYKTALQINKEFEGEGVALYKLDVPTGTDSSDRNTPAVEKAITENMGQYRWVFSYPENINGKWLQALDLLQQNLLPGIISIDKKYTSEPPFVVNKFVASGNLYFHCTPLGSKEEAISCGKQLCEQMGEKYPTEINCTKNTEKNSNNAKKSDDESIPVCPEAHSLLIHLDLKNPETIFKDLHPTKENENQYLENSVRFLLHEYSFGGLWMLFYRKDELDEKWQQAISLYRAREFPGIAWLECITDAPSHRGVDRNVMPIFFRYNLDSDDKEAVLNCGRIIVEKMKYTSNYGHVSFKTYKQGYAGTRSTGVSINYIYRLPVPHPDGKAPKKGWRSTNNTSSSSRHKEKASSGVIERKEDIATKYSADSLGTWEMVFNKPWYDQFWKKSCSLYQEHKLPGIAYLKQSPDNPESRTRAVLFFSGPWQDQDLMEECGRILAETVEYFIRDGKMDFNTFQEGARKILYTVDVPTTFTRK